MSEIPVHPRPRRLAEWINPTDAVVLLFILHFTGTFIPVCITAKWGNAVR